MRLFDKILMFFAGTCFFSIIIILFSGEISYAYTAPPQSSLPVSEQIRSSGATGDIVVYSEDIDKVIDNYFKNIENNPGQREEEQRLITENSNAISKDNLKEAIQKNEVKEPADKSIRYITHVVAKGESLWRIANQYNIPVYTIVSLNKTKANKVIQPGDKLIIASATGVRIKIKKGDTLSGLAKKYKLQVPLIREANKLSGSNINTGEYLFLPGAKPLAETRYVVKNRFRWPLRGRYTSGYGRRIHPISGKRHFHSGIDIGAKTGVPFYAAADGVVIFAGDGGSYGNMIILKHKDGYLTVYAH
ncbi:MAG: M23 family metallopeptidase, partial [Leptospirales bacterium]